MTLEEIYYIGQTIAVVAILASLGAIWFQMRQQARITSTEITRSTSDRAQAILGELYKDAELARLIRVSASHWDKLSANQQLMASNFWWQWVQMGEDLYYQSQNSGFSDATEYTEDMFRAVVAALRMPGVSQWWKVVQQGMAPDYVAMINARLERDDKDSSSWLDLPGWIASEDEVQILIEQDRSSRPSLAEGVVGE